MKSSVHDQFSLYGFRFVGLLPVAALIFCFGSIGERLILTFLIAFVGWFFCCLCFISLKYYKVGHGLCYVDVEEPIKTPVVCN